MFMAVIFKIRKALTFYVLLDAWNQGRSKETNLKGAIL